MHGPGTYQSQPPGITHCRGQPPAAAPHHPGLNNGIVCSEKVAYSVIVHFSFIYSAKITVSGLN
jgi:hypothetical protein